MAIAQTLTLLLERLVLAVEALGIGILVFGSVYLFGRFLAVPGVNAIAERTTADDTLRLTLTKLTGALFLLLGIYLALPLSGLATTPTTIGAITAGATIAIGFASRDILSNLVSGAIIVFDPEFHVGDWIQWNDQEGIIEDIGFRVTRVHTFNNELITVPNSELTSNVVTNPVSKNRLRLSVPFGIGYDDDIDEARHILREVALATDDILERPAPKIHVTDLGESAVEITVFFWVLQPARAEVYRIRSDYVQAAKEHLEAADIELPYPYRELTGEVGTWTAADAPEGVE
jgi:small-conductance mechanosensitive channel